MSRGTERVWDGPKYGPLFKYYWDHQRIVPKMGKFLGKAIWMGIVETYGNPASSIIFNIVVDDVVWAFLHVFCGPQESQHGLGWAAGERNVIFYGNCSRIARRDHDWFQDAMLVTVVMFHRMVLEKNLDKNNFMVCTLGFIWGEWGEQAYKWWSTGEGETFRDRKRLRLSFTACGMTVASSYLKQHMASSHVICVHRTREVDERGGGPTNYVVSFPRILLSVRCLVPRFPTLAHSAGSLREHFMLRNFWSHMPVVQ